MLVVEFSDYQLHRSFGKFVVETSDHFQCLSFRFSERSFPTPSVYPWPECWNFTGGGLELPCCWSAAIGNEAWFYWRAHWAWSVDQTARDQNNSKQSLNTMEPSSNTIIAQKNLKLYLIDLFILALSYCAKYKHMIPNIEEFMAFLMCIYNFDDCVLARTGSVIGLEKLPKLLRTLKSI